jgi:hypothetical protein
MNRDEFLKLVAMATGKPRPRLGYMGLTEYELVRFADLVTKKVKDDEREACAKVCDDLAAQTFLNDPGHRDGAIECAFAIRERGAP